jgi:hypothetical protein
MIRLNSGRFPAIIPVRGTPTAHAAIQNLGISLIEKRERGTHQTTAAHPIDVRSYI